MLYIAMVTTGEARFDAQLQLLKRTLDGHLPTSYLPIVLHPSYSNVQQASNDILYKEVDIGPRRTDPHFVKFSICEFVRILPSSSFRDEMVYLDLDHVCGGPLRFPRVDRHTFFLGSEVELLEDYVSEEQLSRVGAVSGVQRSLTNNKHYNTSLIYGKVSAFRMIAQVWQDLYDGLYDVVSHSVLEELSFVLAARSRRFDVRPAPVSLQSGVGNFDPASSLIHYGGHDMSARQTKRAVLQGADQNTVVQLMRRRAYARRALSPSRL